MREGPRKSPYVFPVSDRGDGFVDPLRGLKRNSSTISPDLRWQGGRWGHSENPGAGVARQTALW